MKSDASLASLVLIAAMAAQQDRLATADVAFVNDQAMWQQAVSGAVGLDFVSANVALANEVLTPPGADQPLGSTLTFSAVNTGFASTVVAEALDSGADFVFDDVSGSGTPPNFENALSVGNINVDENDDVQFSISGASVYAFGINLRDNGTSSSEHFDVYGAGNTLLGSSSDIPGGDSEFLGVISDTPIERVLFDEDSGGDDVAVGGFRLSNTLVPLGCVYDGIYFAGCATDFADQVLRYDPLHSGGPAPTDPDYVNPAAALGPPDFSGDSGSVSLGRGGLIELRFGDNALTNSGNSNLDVHVFEIGSDVEDTFVAIRPTPATLPLLDPSADADGDGYFEIGKVTGSTDSLDIDEFFPGFASGSLRFDAVQLIDDYNEGNSTGVTVGADIDAVGAIASTLPGCDFDQDADCDIRGGVRWPQIDVDVVDDAVPIQVKLVIYTGHDGNADVHRPLG